VIVTTGFLKLYVVAIFGAQTFTGVGRGSHDPNGNLEGPDGNQYCLMSGFILLGSILPGIVAQVVSRLYRRSFLAVCMPFCQRSLVPPVRAVQGKYGDVLGIEAVIRARQCSRVIDSRRDVT
jgi:hypothetical protein